MHAHPRSIYLNCGGSARDTATELYSTASFVSDAAAALAPPQPAHRGRLDSCLMSASATESGKANSPLSCPALSLAFRTWEFGIEYETGLRDCE